MSAGTAHAAGAAVAIAPDPAEQIATLQGRITELEQRRVALQAEHDVQDAQHRHAMRERGRAYAGGPTDPGEITALNEQIAAADAQRAGCVAGLALVDRELAVAREQLLDAQLAASDIALREFDRQRDEVIARIDAVVRDAARAASEPQRATLARVESQATDAWHARAALLRASGRRPEDPSTMPRRDWSQFPDLADVVELLEKYADGRTPGQVRRAELAELAARQAANRIPGAQQSIAHARAIEASRNPEASITVTNWR